jgi:hypothetical protein
MKIFPQIKAELGPWFKNSLSFRINFSDRVSQINIQINSTKKDRQTKAKIQKCHTDTSFYL